MIEQNDIKSSAEQKQPTVIGVVVSNKMDKTIVVRIERKVKHQAYGKYITRSTKLYAHDAENQSQIGDTVRLKQCRPLSKLKRWQLIEVLKSKNALS